MRANGPEGIIEQISLVPHLENKTTKELWREVKKLKEKDGVSETSAPLSIMGMTDYLLMDKRTLSNGKMSIKDEENTKANTLATLPSFLGEYEAKIEIFPIPQSQQIAPKAKDTANLQAILSAPVTATLPLADFLKVKPNLWGYVADMMKSQVLLLTKEMLDRE